ncbi:MAG: Lrp/AsnC family transcriptional regulator [Acidobacteria bacterium]|nr:Lrp/AsnC family transcriptional regulator [Acidobacteriota bacterium]
MTDQHAQPGAFTSESIVLDTVDFKILEILQGDARRSARSIAREIEMSPGAVTERIAKLELSGVIVGYRAEISQQALGYDLQLLIGLQVEQGVSLLGTIDSLLEIREVSSVHIVTGRWDLLLHMRATNHKHLERLLLGKIWEIPGFRHGETMLSLGHYEQPPTLGNTILAEDDGDVSSVGSG